MCNFNSLLSRHCVWQGRNFPSSTRFLAGCLPKLRPPQQQQQQHVDCTSRGIGNKRANREIITIRLALQTSRRLLRRVAQPAAAASFFSIRTRDVLVVRVEWPPAPPQLLLRHVSHYYFYCSMYSTQQTAQRGASSILCLPPPPSFFSNKFRENHVPSREVNSISSEEGD